VSVYRLPAGALLLTGTALEACRYAVAVAQRARARNGLPPSTQLAQLGEALAAAGQTDSPAEPAGQPDNVTTSEAAALLGCSERKARRLAPQLGGRLTGGRWLLDRVAVTEHLEGVNP
jgi:hypothetical protein